MNILLIISKNDRYGAQRLFLDQVDALLRSGHNVVVAGRGHSGYVTDSVRARGLDYHGLALKGLKDLLYLKRLASNNNIDVIHTFLDRADYFGILLSWLVRRPVASTMNVRRFHYGFKLADRVAVVSRKQQDLLLARGVAQQKVALIRPGIDVDRFASPDPEKREAWRRRLRVDCFSIVMLHISSMLSQKNHAASIELAAECRRRGETPLLLIAGDPLHGEYYESLVKKIASAGLENNVVFTGWTAELPELLSLSHFTLLPSVHEAFGMVLLEGMAAGTPIVATEGEGGSELIEEHATGFLYRAGGVGILADAIHDLWQDKERYRNMSEQCRIVARTHYSLEAFGNRLAAFYESLLQESHPEKRRGKR